MIVCLFVYLLTLDYLTADHPQLAHTRTPTVCFAGHNEKRLLHDLLDQYNTLERPVVNESDPLQISFGLTLMQIIDVDEKNQMLVTNIWLKLVSILRGEREREGVQITICCSHQTQICYLSNCVFFLPQLMIPFFHSYLHHVRSFV